MPSMLEAELRRARASYERGAWSETYQALSRAEQTTSLAVDDLEILATSAYLIGRDADFHRCLERAHQAHLQERDESRAARCAFWLGLTLLLRGDVGRANGWLARANRLVEGRDCVERGYLLLPVAEQHLDQRDASAAHEAAATAAEIGERYRDRDLTACARHVQGRALIQRGDVQEGIALLDEAMIAVIAGELSPIITGLVYCSVIDACERVFAAGRAREWTSALARWCEPHPEMVAFTATCLVHRAEVMQLRGEWEEAMAELARACGRIGEIGERNPPASAFYRQGEIHRLRGDFEAAEKAYREASQLGLEPQPGMALLRASQGRIDAASAAVYRVLGTAKDPLHRAKVLPAAIEIALIAGDVQVALDASRELDEIARRTDTEVLHAMAAQARGAVELAEGANQAALGSLRAALTLWQRNEAPYDAARVRLSIALACRLLGDAEAADLELDASRDAFERLGAVRDLARVDALRKGQTPGDDLTSRELQVLRQIAKGKTNKLIAAELFVSERTVDRHVSNILTKLAVPSRAAAVAHASYRKLL